MNSKQYYQTISISPLAVMFRSAVSSGTPSRRATPTIILSCISETDVSLSKSKISSASIGVRINCGPFSNWSNLAAKSIGFPSLTLRKNNSARQLQEYEYRHCLPRPLQRLSLLFVRALDNSKNTKRARVYRRHNLS